MQYLQFTLQKQMAMEQSLTSLAKMSYALTDELVGNGTVTNQGIMTRIRRQDEEGEQKRVADMVAAGTVVPQETAEGSSMVAFTQDFVRSASKKSNEDGTETEVPEFPREYSCCICRQKSWRLSRSS
jgi:hypothetical protein